MKYTLVYTGVYRELGKGLKQLPIEWCWFRVRMAETGLNMELFRQLQPNLMNAYMGVVRSVLERRRHEENTSLKSFAFRVIRS